MSDLYIPRIGPHISFSRIGRSIVWSWEYINRSQSHECGNSDCGRAIPFLGIFVSNFRYWFFAVWEKQHSPSPRTWAWIFKEWRKVELRFCPCLLLSSIDYVGLTGALWPYGIVCPSSHDGQWMRGSFIPNSTTSIQPYVLWYMYRWERDSNTGWGKKPEVMYRPGRPRHIKLRRLNCRSPLHG
jgi:hypothetical protein